MVDASVGTNSDDFYRSTKSRKVQIDAKKKSLLTTSASTGTGTDLGNLFMPGHKQAKQVNSPVAKYF